MASRKTTTSIAAGIPTRYLYNGIIVSLVMILAGSLKHLAFTFSSVEPQDNSLLSWAIPWVIALGIEAGMMAIAFGVALRRRRKEKAGFLLFGLGFFAFINFYANVYFAISVYTDVRNLKWADVNNLDSLVLITILILAGSLPVLIMMLAELQSLFFIQLKSEEFSNKLAEEKERKKEEQKLAREQKKRNPRKAVGNTGEVTVEATGDSYVVEEEEEEEVLTSPLQEEDDFVAPEPPVKRHGRSKPEQPTRPLIQKKKRVEGRATDRQIHTW